MKKNLHKSSFDVRIKKTFVLPLFIAFTSLAFSQENVFIQETQTSQTVVIGEDDSQPKEDFEAFKEEPNAFLDDAKQNEENPNVYEGSAATLDSKSHSDAESDLDDGELYDSFSKETDEDFLENKNTENEKEISDGDFSYKIQKKTVAAKRPKKPTSDQIHDSQNRTENKKNTYVKDCTDTLNYGLESEISDLLDEFIKNEDMRFVDPIYDLFQSTKNPVVRNKIISYFTKLKDPCLSDYAVDIINDPYDARRDTVDLCFKYAVEVECREAVGGLVDLVDKEEDDYFNGALSALAELGSNSEASFLARYLERDDLTVAQRQSLMRALGKMKAASTWDVICEIAQDEDENSFVRMYAAEAIGAIGKSEGLDILINLFETDDPNLRIYVIKGLSFYDDKKADAVIIQALKDSQYKVRLESVSSIKTRSLKQAVPALVYRCKHKDEEKVVKEKCYDVIAFLNTDEGNEYLVSILNDKKIADGTKAKVASCLLEYNHAGSKEIINLARNSLKDDKQKNLRYALGKEFAKYGRSEYEDICGEYIAHADVATQGTGLDIWAKGRYSSLKPKVQALAKEAEEDESENASASNEGEKSKPSKPKKRNANAVKAKRILDSTEDLDAGLKK